MSAGLRFVGAAHTHRVLNISLNRGTYRVQLKNFARVCSTIRKQLERLLNHEADLLDTEKDPSSDRDNRSNGSTEFTSKYHRKSEHEKSGEPTSMSRVVEWNRRLHDAFACADAIGQLRNLVQHCEPLPRAERYHSTGVLGCVRHRDQVLGEKVAHAERCILCLTECLPVFRSQITQRALPCGARASTQMLLQNPRKCAEQTLHVL
mmetsp:Transcript_42416/g.70533  ORF Transcript_42416/g.70533 Transcript_42416/m.70533 type:complete len:206 (-) Transcript_42416:583-1200(-)